MLANHRKIAQALLAFKKDRPLQNDEETSRLTRHYIDEYPHAFVVACVADKQIKYERAWKIPDDIGKELGGFDLNMWLEKKDAIRDFFMTHKPKPHRFKRRIPEEIIGALERVRDVYEGDASRIWRKPKGAGEIVLAFRRFKGIGQKVSNMAAYILSRHFNYISGKHLIDIPVDVHVRRVFSRTGLTAEDESDDGIVYKARALNPDYPAALDTAWNIGLHYCRPQRPDCPRCPLVSLCAYSRN